MEVDDHDIQGERQNPKKIASAYGGGWPSNRIVRVSRGSGGKDRHSKVVTSKGLRDRRVRLSVTTAIQFYDLQDRLGYDQPSKAVDWLLKAAAGAIDELPSLEPLFPRVVEKNYTGKQVEGRDLSYQSYKNNDGKFDDNDNNNNNVALSSSASETSKGSGSGSGLSLSRSANRVRARERARQMAVKRENEKIGVSETSSFTDLLRGGSGTNSTDFSPTSNVNPGFSPDSRVHWTTTSPMDYFHIPQFNVTTGDNHGHQQHEFSFLQENFGSGTVGGAGVGSDLVSGLHRGTLQSNLLSSLPQHHNIGSTSTNYPFFIAPNHHLSESGFESQGLQLYGGGGGGLYSDHHKGKQKN